MTDVHIPRGDGGLVNNKVRAAMAEIRNATTLILPGFEMIVKGEEKPDVRKLIDDLKAIGIFPGTAEGAIILAGGLTTAASVLIAAEAVKHPDLMEGANSAADLWKVFMQQIAELEAGL
jgi:hypothetical protein